MSMDITGITNQNEYYTNHYFATVFEENAGDTISRWNTASKESEEVKPPWSMLRQNARQFYTAHDRFNRSSFNMQMLVSVRTLANAYLKSLGYPEVKPELVAIDDSTYVPVYLEMKKSNGAPLLWIMLSASSETDSGIMESYVYNSDEVDEDAIGVVYKGLLNEMSNEDLATKILFGVTEPPRFLMFIGMNQIALIDRNKWNEKRYLQFELETIFSRLENTTLQAMSVLLHKDSLCPEDGKILLDELDELSQKNASGVSQNLKYALRESIELLGNEVLYDMEHRIGRNFETDPVDAGQLTIECLRYMYRMLFVLFIESRPELGYAPIKAQSYYTGYSLESLRDIADNIRDDIDEVGNGYYLHETLAKLYELIYNGYPKTEEELEKATGSDSLHDMFLIAPLKAHIFDPEYTKMITTSKLRNSCMLRIVELMSLTKDDGKKNSRRGRISYSNLGINQMGAVYEALLSYRGFIAEHDLYEVKRVGDKFNELDVGYFVPESDLDQYTEDERVRYESGEKKGQLRMYEKGTFIYRLAGREREKSASYYTPEVLTKCLVKYALKELLEGKTADEILELTVCEPAMGSAAFLNETINQLAEAYITKKEQETGNIISYEKRFNELQKVKMYIADRNVYGIDLNPIAVELAEVSLWLNTIYEGGFVPWFGTQLVNGNSLIGARRQVYSESMLQTSSKGLHWYENAPERVPLGTERKKRRGNSQIYHFLLGDPGMCSYSDKVIKALEPENIKLMKEWNKKFTATYAENDLETLRRLSNVIDDLWNQQIKNRKKLEELTQDSLSIYQHEDSTEESHTSIRQKDTILHEFYKSEQMNNAGPYARLKFAMDYWCSLWFWPIDKAELLPTRSEFLFDMSTILEGTLGAIAADTSGQISWDTTNINLGISKKEHDLLAQKFIGTYGDDSVVDIPTLIKNSERLALASQIAMQNKFMHWELEFADMFAERGGFDLIIGNPPWIKITWNEQDLLSDCNPMFAVKNLSASDTTKYRSKALEFNNTKTLYLHEYEMMAGEQTFLNAISNFPYLKGQQTNLFRCFLPQAWMYGASLGVSAFIHPDGVYDDPKGGVLREQIYPRLKYRFNFRNELLLFKEVSHLMTFSLNIYSNKNTTFFDAISTLFTPNTINECYDRTISGEIPGIKTKDNNWNISGHPNRVLHVSRSELELFAHLFDGSDNWKQARLPVLHAAILLDILSLFANQKKYIQNLGNDFFATVMWDETNAQKKLHVIQRNVHSPIKPIELIYSGSHIGVANPLFKASKKKCEKNSDFDSIDLTNITDDYLQRCNYMPDCDISTYQKNVGDTAWGKKYNECYRVCMRRMLNQSGERTLIPAIVPPYTGHINTVIGIAIKDSSLLAYISGLFSTVVADGFIKILGKSDMYAETLVKFPLVNGKYRYEIQARALLLNCLNNCYSELLEEVATKQFCDCRWSRDDERLKNSKFSALSNGEWNYETPLRNDYARRFALVELDVLIALEYGLTIQELINLYHIQFPVLQSYEVDTWYDANGRIVFTNNRSLSGMGFERNEWENNIKGAPSGTKFYRTITDDTMPGGPVERTIEYVAPFDRCDREQDYETAWKFFEEKYK